MLKIIKYFVKLSKKTTLERLQSYASAHQIIADSCRARSVDSHYEAYYKGESNAYNNIVNMIAHLLNEEENENA